MTAYSVSGGRGFNKSMLAALLVAIEAERIAIRAALESIDKEERIAEAPQPVVIRLGRQGGAQWKRETAGRNFKKHR